MPISRFSTWTFVICLLLSAILAFHLLFRFITPVVIAMVIVSIFKPVYIRLLKLLWKRDYLAASVATTLVFLGVLIPLTLFFILLVQQGLSLFQASQRITSSTDVSVWALSLKNYLDVLNNYLRHFDIHISSERVLGITASLFQTIGAWLYESIGHIATNMITLCIDFFLTVALVFVFFISGKEAKKFVMDLVPLPDDEKNRLVQKFRDLSLAVFVGNGLISVVEGVLGGLLFLIFGMSGALIWGVVMTVTAFLPVVGATVVIIPATIYLFLMDRGLSATLFLIINAIQLGVLETLVKPRLIGKKSQMHSALVFMSVLAGIQVYGIFGLFYGPLLVTIFLALAEIYKDHYRENLVNKKRVLKTIDL